MNFKRIVIFIKLIIDITTNLITQIRGSREVETKHGHGYKLSN